MKQQHRDIRNGLCLVGIMLAILGGIIFASWKGML